MVRRNHNLEKQLETPFLPNREFIRSDVDRSNMRHPAPPVRMHQHQRGGLTISHLHPGGELPHEHR